MVKILNKISQKDGLAKNQCKGKKVKRHFICTSSTVTLDNQRRPITNIYSSSAPVVDSAALDAIQVKHKLTRTTY